MSPHHLIPDAPPGEEFFQQALTPPRHPQQHMPGSGRDDDLRQLQTRLAQLEQLLGGALREVRHMSGVVAGMRNGEGNADVGLAQVAVGDMEFAHGQVPL